MAKIIICDICGDRITKYDDLIKVKIKDFTNSGAIYSKETYDLCECCRKKLMIFLKVNPECQSQKEG